MLSLVASTRGGAQRVYYPRHLMTSVLLPQADHPGDLTVQHPRQRLLLQASPTSHGQDLPRDAQSLRNLEEIRRRTSRWMHLGPVRTALLRVPGSIIVVTTNIMNTLGHRSGLFSRAGQPPGNICSRMFYTPHVTKWHMATLDSIQSLPLGSAKKQRRAVVG